jgi:pilus assembly protein CpaC
MLRTSIAVFLLLASGLIGQEQPATVPPAASTAQSGAPSQAPTEQSATPAQAPTEQYTAPAQAPVASVPNVEHQLAVRATAPDSGGASAASPQKEDQGAPGEGPNTIHLIVGRSSFISTKSRLRRVYVSNPEVLDAINTSPTEVVITAKTPGTSTFALWNEDGEFTVYTVLADLYLAGLGDMLAQALPGDHVEAKAEEGRIHLTGVVGSESAAIEAGHLASIYSKNVVNALVIDPRHLPQVQLQVRFAELDRSKLTQFGFNFLSTGQNVATSTTGAFGPAAPAENSTGNTFQLGLSDLLNLFYFNRALNIGATVKLLQQKGILEVLAEPTLATISGQPAKFLAGGEFPYPVIQGSNGGFTSVTIQFRPYGVKLEFTPFVNPDGTIRLKVNPEVSALDYTNAVTISGYTIPAISTRHADTEIELQSGQSFGISGLLDHRVTDTLSKIPGISEIPILGQLFRSKNLNHSISELIVIVTPTIVDPLNQPNVQPGPLPQWPVPFLNPNHFDKGLPDQKNKPGEATSATGKP